MKTCHEAMPQIKTKPPFHMRAGMCVCVREYLCVCVWPQNDSANAMATIAICSRLPPGEEASKSSSSRPSLAPTGTGTVELVVRLVGHIYVRVQWAAFGLLYFQFLPLSAFAALRASLKGGRMQPQSNNSSRSTASHTLSLRHPCPACDAGKFAARQRNEAMRTKSRN